MESFYINVNRDSKNNIMHIINYLQSTFYNIYSLNEQIKVSKFFKDILNQ